MLTSTRSKDRVWVLCAVIACLLVQLVGIAVLSERSINMDSIEYLELSRSIVLLGEYSAPAGLNSYDSFQGESPTRMRQPMYPLFLALLRRTTDNSTLPVQILQAFMNCVSLWLLFAIADSISAFRLRPISLIMPVVYFPWLILSSMVLSESLFTMIMWAAVYLLTKYIQSDNKKFLVFTGFLLGILTLTKSIGFMIGIAFAIPLVAYRGFLRGMISWIVGMVFAATLLVPWGIRNYKEMGVFSVFPSNSGYNLWIASRPIDSPWWDDDEAFQTATEGWKLYYIDSTADVNFRREAYSNFLASSPFTVVSTAFRRWLSAWFRFPGSGDLAGWNTRYVALSLFQTAFLGLAVYGAFRVKKAKALLILIIPVLALSCSLPLTKGLTRYLLPGWPPVTLLAGHGLAELKIRRKSRS